MSKISTSFIPLLVLAVMSNTPVKAQTTNAAPYCQYNANRTMQGYSGAISKVTLGTLSNSTGFGNLTAYNSTSGACQQLYTYYNNVAAPGLPKGSSQTIQLEFKSWFDGEPVKYAAYIDFNHDNAFDTSTEMIIDMAHANVIGMIPSNNAPAIITATRSNTFTVPANAVTGTTRMRVIRSHWDNVWYDSVSRVPPCVSYIYGNSNVWKFGEVEDYDVMIAAPIPVPSLTALNAGSITSSSVVLTGTVNANGGNVALFFDYGTTTAYGSSVAATPSTVNGTNAIPITATKTGLSPNTLYHYRIRAVAGSNTYYSAESTFTTKATATGVGTANAADEIKIYPNPTTGNISIEVPGAVGAVEIVVFNVAGAAVFSGKEPGQRVKTISLHALPDGLYHLQVTCGDRKSRKTVSIVH